MLFFKRIKQLEEQVAELKIKTQILEDRTEILAGRMSKGFHEIDELYALLVNKQTHKDSNVAETPTEPKPRRKYRARKLNGKENNSATE
jgi:hypothetical protein